MSLFGSLFRDMERDPIFGAHQRAMNRMMGGNSFFPPMFPGLDFGHGGHGGHPLQQEMMPFQAAFPFGPGGFGGGMDMLAHHAQGGGLPTGSNMFCSSSVTSFTSGPNGPQVYQASSQTHQAGNVKETRKSVQDSRSGLKKLSVGRTINDRQVIKERKDNIYTGESVINEEFVNLDADEVPTFNNEWSNIYGGAHAHRAQQPRAIQYPSQPIPGPHRDHYSSHQHQQQQQHQQPTATAGRNSSHHNGVTIEELPSSEDEEMVAAARAPPPPPRRPPPPAATSSSRRQTSSSGKDKDSKRSKAKKVRKY